MIPRLWAEPDTRAPFVALLRFLTSAAARMMRAALLRYVFEVPPTATEDETVALVGPAIRYYLDGGQPPAASQR
ncbi:hypothetical protein BA062_23605 [Prauserella flavalba]|uniref:Tetracyclin repressor-like C-terminal domain-containing protein n=1 Tax=Prauserella flavalba TaxID=1477506 RepID=A0A318LIM7_9PSEU|nr:hypothetical protein BA062_23605 [Prauserella flavalba]